MTTYQFMSVKVCECESVWICVCVCVKRYFRKGSSFKRDFSWESWLTIFFSVGQAGKVQENGQLMIKYYQF